MTPLPAVLSPSDRGKLNGFTEKEFLAATMSAVDGAAVTPSDATQLTGVRALWIGTGGNVGLAFGSSIVVLKNIPDGTLLPVAPSKVRSTGTTASDIVALK